MKSRCAQLSFASSFLVLGAFGICGASTALAAGPPWISLDDEPKRWGPGADTSSSWRFELMPVVWLARVSGSQQPEGLDASGSEAEVETSADIDFAGMLRAEAGKGDLSLRLSASYLEFDFESTGPNETRLDTTLKTTIVDASLGYRIAGDPWDKFDGAQRGTARPGYVDALAGARLVSISVDLDFATLPSADDSVTWVDPYVGARGRIFAFPWLLLGAEATIGGFGVGSELAWTAEATAQFVLSKTVYVALGYTVVDLDYEEGGDDGYSIDAQLRGPWLGVGFVF